MCMERFERPGGHRVLKRKGRKDDQEGCVSNVV